MSNIRSLGDLQGGDGSDDDDKHNEYYAGGEKSGQVIRGAPKGGHDDKDEDQLSNLFEAARRAGAQQGTQEDLQGGPSAFRGTGRTLAQDSTPAERDSGPVTHIITFYRNGIFTVNNGPGRRAEDPANHEFVDSIAKGQCPTELEPGRPGVNVTVNLVRKDEDYTEPEKPRYQAFQGQARTLSSSASAATSSAAPPLPLPASSTTAWEGVDEQQPTTSIQLRLADGSRMVAKFNYTHTVADVRRFIRAARPEMSLNYQLMTAFPSQLITDEAQTLEAAQLLNAVIIQKAK